jgi:hypothetical protein
MIPSIAMALTAGIGALFGTTLPFPALRELSRIFKALITPMALTS